MKLGTLLKLGLVGGGIYYVKKNGGFKATWDKLSTKLESVKGELKSDVKSQSPTRSMYESDTDFASSSSYGDEASGSIAGSDKTGFNRG